MRRRRGFTLIELVTVVAVIGILTAVAVPYFGELSRRGHVSAATRRMVGTLRDSRAAAIARRSVNGAPVEAMSVRIDSLTRYSQVADPDNDPTNGNEVVLQTIDLTVDRAVGLTIAAPAVGTSIRFRRDGGTAATAIVLSDTGTYDQRTINLTAGGQASIE